MLLLLQRRSSTAFPAIGLLLLLLLVAPQQELIPQRARIVFATAFIAPVLDVTRTTSHHTPQVRRGSAVPASSSGRPTTSTTTSTSVLWAGKDWDEILKQADDDDKESTIQDQIPIDMQYNIRNCNRASKNYAAMQMAGGPGADVYGCVPSSSTSIDDDDDDDNAKNNEEDETTAVFWFLGKVSHVSDVSLEQCVARQWSLIQQHAANLRPLELFALGSTLDLELWCAPLHSEMDVAYSRPSIQFQKMDRVVDGADQVKTNLIGFQGEVYNQGEEGFRTIRYRSDGRPAKPEITTASPATAPGTSSSQESDEKEDTAYRDLTDDEMEQLQKALEGKDINEVYEALEEEKRKQE